MRTDARADFLRTVDDDSTPAEKALWHAVISLEEWADDGIAYGAQIQKLIAQVEADLSSSPTTESETSDG